MLDENAKQSYGGLDNADGILSLAADNMRHGEEDIISQSIIEDAGISAHLSSPNAANGLQQEVNLVRIGSFIC